MCFWVLDDSIGLQSVQPFPTFSLTERRGFAVFARNVLGLSNSFLVFHILAILCIATVVEGGVY